MQLLSLGYDCKVAWQIRRHSGQDQAFFFDWLMTPPDALSVLLGRDEDLLRDGRWELIKDDCCLRDLDTGLMFMHEFPSVPVVGGEQSHRILPELVSSHLPVARAKFAYLRRKTLELIRHSPDLLLVRADEVATLDEAMAQANQMRRLFLPINPRLKFAVASTLIPASGSVADTLIFKTEPGEDWRGGHESWSQLFRTAERLFAPQPA